jgi:hypothetical protein
LERRRHYYHGQLGAEASIHEIEVEAAKAVQAVAAEFTVRREADADAAERDRLISWLPLQLMRDLTREGCEVAIKAVRAAFAELPVGTPREQLQKASDTALAPFHAAVAERRRILREQTDAEQKKLWARLEAQLRPQPTQRHRAPVVTRRPAASRGDRR